MTCVVTLFVMAEVTIRELQDHGGNVVDRVVRGERITITRAGQPVAELRPVSQPPLMAETLLARWRGLPPVDYRTLRAEIDEVLKPAL
jgi:prevent-host-death family protein